MTNGDVPEPQWRFETLEETLRRHEQVIAKLVESHNDVVAAVQEIIDGMNRPEDGDEWKYV